MSVSESQPYRRLEDTQSARLYQVWEGDNRFCCGGRLMLGPAVGQLVFVILLNSGSAATFLAIVCVSSGARGASRVTVLPWRARVPGLPRPTLLAFGAASAALVLAVFVFLGCSALVEPGSSYPWCQGWAAV